MVCSKCGVPLPAEAIFCPHCGERTLVAINPDTDTLEDDLLLALLEEEEEERERQRLEALNSQEVEAETQKSAPSPVKYRPQPVARDDQAARQRDSRYQREMAQKKEQIRRENQERARRRKSRNSLIVLIIIIAILVGGGSYFVYYRMNNSVEYMMDRAHTSYDRKDYQNALSMVEKALKIDPDNVDALVMEGKIDYFMLESDNAEGIFKHVLELDDLNVDAYTYLLKIYSDKNDYNSILSLKEDVTDATILALFESYLVPAPEFDLEEGTYNEYLDVQLSSSQRNMTFYYTLDGTTPTKESDKYDGESVRIEEQGEVILTAIAVDASGRSSEPVSVKYTIELLIPNTPVVAPDGGQFTYGSSIEITSDPGTTIYYTWDGTVPTADSYEYTAPIWMPEGNNILSVVAIDEFDMVSEVLQCNFIYYPPIETKPAPVTEQPADGTPMDGE